MLLFIFYTVVVVWIFRKLTVKMSDSLGCLIGKTAIVTGGNSGIGFEVSSLLASRGCRVIIADRDNSEESCEKIKSKTGNPNVSYKYLDLASLKQVREFAADIKKSEPKIDVLINNAGISGSMQTLTQDGLNITMQINFFGSFLLTHLLISSLRAAKSPRIIFNASLTAYFHDFAESTLNESRENTTKLRLFRQYSNSKLCNILAAQEFGRRLKQHGITCNAADPGAVGTNIWDLRWSPISQISIFILRNVILPVSLRTPYEGAQTAFHLASSEKLEGVTGEDFYLCRKWFKPWILKDEAFVKKVWEQSEELVKLTPEERLA